LENKQLKLKLVEKKSNGKDHELLASVKEELKGIRNMLE
jgi:hypothetical protein